MTGTNAGDGRTFGCDVPVVEVSRQKLVKTTVVKGFKELAVGSLYQIAGEPDIQYLKVKSPDIRFNTTLIYHGNTKEYDNWCGSVEDGRTVELLFSPA
jgi:hypothetical protein